MPKDKFNGFILVASVLVVIGLIFIFFSDNFGIYLTNDWVLKYEYSDSSMYEHEVKTQTTKFIVTGSIFLATGLTALLLVYYKLIRMKE